MVSFEGEVSLTKVSERVGGLVRQCFGRVGTSLASSTLLLIEARA